jgi:hypothetical protein
MILKLFVYVYPFRYFPDLDDFEAYVCLSLYVDTFQILMILKLFVYVYPFGYFPDPDDFEASICLSF